MESNKGKQREISYNVESEKLLMYHDKWKNDIKKFDFLFVSYSLLSLFLFFIGLYLESSLFFSMSIWLLVLSGIYALIVSIDKVRILIIELNLKEVKNGNTRT